MVSRNSINLSTRPKEGVHFTYRRSYRGEESCGCCARILDSYEVRMDGLVKKNLGEYSLFALAFVIFTSQARAGDLLLHGPIADDG